MQQSQSFRSQVSVAGAYVFLGKCVRYSLQYGTQFFLINLLLPSEFGLMRYVTILVGMASLINEMGLTTAIVQKQQLRAEEIAGCFTASMIWGLLLYVVVFLTAPFTASFFKNSELINYLRIGSLLIPVSSVCSVPRALLQKQLRFGTLASIEASAAVISSILMVFMAFKGYGTWSLISGALVQEILSLTLLFFLIKIPGVNFRALFNSGSILGTGAGLVVLRIADYLRFSMPFFVIGKLFDEKSLGLFSFSYDISILPQVVINAVLGNITVSMFSRLQNNRSGTENGFVHLTFITSAFVIPVLLSMSLLSEEIVRAICIFKKNTIWMESSILMRWLSLMGVFYAISVFPSTIWISNKRIVPSILWSFVMLLTTIVAIFSAFKWGIEGIAVALFIRAAVVFPLFAYVNFRITGIKTMVYLKSIYPAFAGGVLVSITVFTIKNMLPGVTLFRDAAVLLISALAGGGIYLVYLRFFSGPLLNPWTDVLQGVKRRVPFFYR